MNVSVNYSKLSGDILAPASKSVMQRACAAAIVRGGETFIHNYGKSNDDQAALKIIEQLGASMEIINDKLLRIHAENFPKSISTDEINCAESGLSARLFTALAALSNREMKITGHGSLLQRPFHFFDDVFPQLNVAIKSNKGYLPLEIKGKLQPKNINIDGSLSSQYLTGLLFAFSALNQEAVISVEGLKSKPYIDLTLKLMKDFGLNVPENNNYESFVFQKSKVKSQKSKIDYTVEGDWSGAAFLLVAGAINGDIKIKGLQQHSFQADRKIVEVLQQCGCNISVHEDEITIGKSTLIDFKFDATDCPDLFPPLAALALFCNGSSIISGVHRLLHKESNRAESIQAMCEQFGGDISIEDDAMIIHGGKSLKPTVIDSFNDHRIAMAAAVIAMNIDGKSTIQRAECVNKSYPDFWNDIQKLGALITMQ